MSVAAGAPLLMKRDRLKVARSCREDNHQHAAFERVFETVLWCLDEPLHVTSSGSNWVRARRRYWWRPFKWPVAVRTAISRPSSIDSSSDEEARRPLLGLATRFW